MLHGSTTDANAQVSSQEDFGIMERILKAMDTKQVNRRVVKTDNAPIISAPFVFKGLTTDKIRQAWVDFLKAAYVLLVRPKNSKTRPYEVFLQFNEPDSRGMIVAYNRVLSLVSNRLHADLFFGKINLQDRNGNSVQLPSPGGKMHREKHTFIIIY